MKASVVTDAIKRQNRAAGRQITAPGTRAETQPSGSTEHSLLWGKSEPERPRGREGGCPGHGRGPAPRVTWPQTRRSLQKGSDFFQRLCDCTLEAFCLIFCLRKQAKSSLQQNESQCRINTCASDMQISGAFTVPQTRY